MRQKHPTTPALKWNTKSQIRLILIDACEGFPLVYAVSEIARDLDFEIFQTEAAVSAGISWAIIWGVSYGSVSAAP